MRVAGAIGGLCGRWRGALFAEQLTARHIMSEEINQEILPELRKLERIFYVMLVFVIVGIVPAFYRGFSRGLSQAVPSWQSVDIAMKAQGFPKALAEAQALVARQPNYYYGEAYLVVIYLAIGCCNLMHCIPPQFGRIRFFGQTAAQPWKIADDLFNRDLSFARFQKIGRGQPI